MSTQLRHIIIAMVLATATVLVVPAVASAHDSTDVNIHVNCDTRRVTVDVGYANFHGNGEYLHVTTDVEGHEFYDDSEALNGSGVFHVGPHPIVYDDGSVLVTVEVYSSDGSVIDGSKVVYPRYYYSCPSPVYAPKAKILGPCGDPMYGWFFNNRGSDRAVTFKVSFTKYGGDRVVKYRTVAAHTRVWSGWKHVEGKTSIVIRARGKTLAYVMAAPNGNYQSCEALLAKYKANNP